VAGVARGVIVINTMEVIMSLGTLAESIILQALEDLGDPRQRAESMDFLHGYRLRLFARMAGMRNEDIIGFHAWTRAYCANLYGAEEPGAAGDIPSTPKARVNTRYHKPLFMHIMGRC